MVINIMGLEGWSIKETEGYVKVNYRGKTLYRGPAQEVNIINQHLFIDGCKVAG